MSAERKGGRFDPTRFTGAGRRPGVPSDARRFDPVVGGALRPLRGLERAAFEAVELGAVRAEKLVHPHITAGRCGPLGWSSVVVDFRDVRLASAFRRARLIEAGSPATSWTIARRWADADDCAALDEQMCAEVVRELHAWFARRLKAWVLTTLEGGGE